MVTIAFVAVAARVAVVVPVPVIVSAHISCGAHTRQTRRPLGKSVLVDKGPRGSFSPSGQRLSSTSRTSLTGLQRAE